MQSTIVVVPCFNEAERFKSEPFVIAGSADPSLSFLLVDDGSSDSTRSVLERLQAHPSRRFSVLALDRNCGKAEAVRAGLGRAFERSPSLVGYFDADLATPIPELSGMRALFDADPELLAVLGSRVGLLGREVVRSPHRHYLGRLFASAASLALDLTVYDTQCGAKIFRNTAAVRKVFSEPFESRWTFDVEVLARLNALAKDGEIPPLSRAAAEYPLNAWRDVSGSKLGARAAVGAGLELARLWLRYRDGWRR